MIFLQIEDFYTVITEDHLNEVVDNDIIFLDAAELTAMGEMTGYLDVRFDSTKCFETDDEGDRIAIIVATCVDITLYHAHARIMPDNIPTLREKRYDNAIEWLNKVASGYINPKLPVKEDEPTSTPLRYGNSSEKFNSYY